MNATKLVTYIQRWQQALPCKHRMLQWNPQWLPPQPKPPPGSGQHLLKTQRTLAQWPHPLPNHPNHYWQGLLV